MTRSARRRRPASAAAIPCPACDAPTTISNSRVLHGVKTRYRNCTVCDCKVKTKQRMTPELGVETIAPLCSKLDHAEARSKITAEDVREIRVMLQKQYDRQFIADRFGITRYMVGSIDRGDNWGWLK